MDYRKFMEQAMDYRKIIEQADRLEAQAAELRKKAEETKANDAAKNTAKIKEARKGVVAATLNYLETVDVAPNDDEDVKALEEIFDVLFDELEKSIDQAKRKADMLDSIIKDMMKESNLRPTVKKVDISDDEKLFNFLRKISE